MLLLDSNVWDKLADDETAREKLNAMCLRGSLEVIVPATLKRELFESPFKGIPDWFPTSDISDSVFVLGHSRLGSARFGSGKVYATHLGESRKFSDAVLADAANSERAIFVSEDKRARKRFAEAVGVESSLDFAAFRSQILRL